MVKLTIEELRRIKVKVQKQNLLRTSEYRIKMTVHLGACGMKAGAEKILHELMTQLSQHDVSGVVIATADCIKKCSQEPLVTVEEKGKDSVIYGSLTPDKIRKIFKGHIMGGEIQNAFFVGSKQETSL